MAVYEYEGAFHYKDEKNNLYRLYPITKLHLVEGLPEELEKYASSVGSAIIRTITVPAAGWEKADTDTQDLGDHLYTADIEMEEAKADHFPTMALDIPSVTAASKAGLCPTIEVLDGIVRFWAQSIPSADLIGTILLRSENLSQTGTSGGSYDMATDEEVEAVINDIFGG